MRVNTKLIQLAGDALIPILGFFFWDWGLYFIVIFYLLDYIVSEILTHLKAKRIFGHDASGRTIWFRKGAMSISLLIAVILLSHLAIYKIHPEMDLSRELVNFWSYKDMGIEQGYLLLPLIMIVGYQRYKLEFLVPQMYSKVSMDMIWKQHLRAHCALLGFIGLLLGISVIVILPETVYLSGIILLTSLYQLFFKGN